MPQLNKSEAVHQRLRCFLRRLISFANDELPECESLERKISVRWTQEEAGTPKLIVKTEIRFLAALVFQSAGPKTKDHLKQDLRTLKDFLGLLEDNRDRTQGSGLWHFTLTLWHKSVDKNLAAFDEHWQRCKQALPKSSRPSVVKAPAPSASAVVTMVPSRPHASQEQEPFEKKIGVYHNLPGRDYGTLIGREQPLQQVISFLAAGHPAARLSVTGVGGIGKTALVLEAAYGCLKVSGEGGEDAFDAVIFTVTKKQRFTPHGILHNYRYSQTLQDLFRTIAQTLGCPDVLTGDFTKQIETIYELLSYQRTLLIIDNLEMLLPESRQAVLSFLYGLPATVKVIVMSRLHLPMDEVIPLARLGESESMAFIHQQAQLKAVELSASERQRFRQQTYGMPAAMVYAMGQLAAGYRISQVLPQLTLSDGDYCRYYLEHAVQSLVGKPAFDLLIALSLFPHGASREALIFIAGFSGDISDEAITESFVALQQRSLIQCQFQGASVPEGVSVSGEPQERYSMLPLTREYVLSSCKDALLKARERWLGWYKQWLQAYDHKDWRVWQDYSQIDVEWNALQAVIEWCIAENRYGDFSVLWGGIRGYTHLRGLWAERLSWLEGWLQAVQVNQNRAVTMQVLGDLSWTLMLMGEPQQLAAASAYLSQAWAYSEALISEALVSEALVSGAPVSEVTCPQEVLGDRVLMAQATEGAKLTDYRSYQIDLAIDQGVLLLFQASLDEAAVWLEIAHRLIATSPDAEGTREGTREDTTAPHRPRAAAQKIRLDYYNAQLCYRQRDYSKAKSLYRKILQRAQQQSPSLLLSTQRQQAEVYSLNWLVDIALKENNVKEADRLLQQSWSVIQGGKDLRSQAFHQRSKAKLEKRRGNLADFQHWSKQAKACFETLGMHPQAQEMHEWLMENNSRPPNFR